MEEELYEIFLNETGINFSNDKTKRNAHFFSSQIAMQPRELVGVVIELEKKYKIKIPDASFIKGDFCCFNNVLNILNKIH